MARAQGARATMNAVFETVYGTSPVTGFKTLPFASFSVGTEQDLLDSELLGFGRDPLAPILDVIAGSGDIKVPMDVEAWGMWLRATFGSPVTTGTTPKVHTFSSGNWTIPSMSVEIGMPEVPHFAMNAGIVVDELSWTMERSGLLTATAKVMSQGEVIAAATAAGTPTAFALQRFGNFQGGITRDAVAMGNVVSASVSYKNNLDPIELIRSDGKMAGFDPSMAMLSGSIDIRFDSQTLMTQATSGVSCALVMSWSLGANASFSFTIPRVFLSKPKATIDGPKGVMATFNWQAAQQANGNPMCTAVLTNTVTGY